MRLLLCFLLSLVLTQVLAITECEDDYHGICRTDFRYRVTHDWIPYANSTPLESGIKWRVIVDQYDYQTLIGVNSIPPGRWRTLNDQDGDTRGWIPGGGGTCTFQLRLNTYRVPTSNNWVFTQAIQYCDAIELFLNASVRFVSCTQRGESCKNPFVIMHRYDTNSPNEVDRMNPVNYEYFTGELETSKLAQDINSNDDTNIVRTFARPEGFSHTYFGLQDIGTIGQLQRFFVYYKVCQNNSNGLEVYPEVPLPPTGSTNPTVRLAYCVDNAHNVTALETYAYGDKCVQNVRCECNDGYSISENHQSCVACPRGQYKSSENATCVQCPENTKGDEEAASECQCADGYFRAEHEGVGVGCTAPPSPIPDNLKVVDVCDTYVVLEWQKPLDVGRSDFYYDVLRNDPVTDEEIEVYLRLLDNSDVVQYRVTGLQPSTSYTFSVCVHNGVSEHDDPNARLRVVSKQGTTLQGSVFVLDGTILPSNSVVIREDIGTGEKVLTCRAPQCGERSQPSFYFPDGAEVPSGNTNSLYQVGQVGEASLNRNEGDRSPLGKYSCRVTDSEGALLKIFVKLATLSESGTNTSTCPPTTPTSPPTTTTQSIVTGNNLRLELNGKIYVSGSIIYKEDIGEGSEALICYTDRLDCCDGANRYGEFISPTGVSVGIEKDGDELYRDRGSGLIRLNRNSVTSTSPTGVYRCEIPNSNGETQSIVFNIQNKDVPLCPPLENFDNGQVKIFPIAEYNCNDGYRRTGPSTRTCEADGTWTGFQPTCERIQSDTCPPLPKPANGRVIQYGNNPGSLALYICSAGFQIADGMSNLRSCDQNGSWTGKTPTCV